jgi:hypothetical protein
MDWRHYVRSELREITGDAARDQDIVEELALHLAQRHDELRAAGASDADAADRAARELRDSPQLARFLRDANRAPRARLNHLPLATPALSRVPGRTSATPCAS